ncbi:dihydrofolate synthase / folylpolyglutamate synthase [Allopseudospirillum japonicum]|uniref:Dihydrofolate synthase/folylpolyglutamate synthase n=1 Tax=Allopseudospirillum japonicum TaxID=64971 RepID=A0A1H6SSE6_9GAMM|nr:bifunctional tetrahydrofolate synthase/dihydrofolate synthase [Allopseudospirillum japonicum]SEI68694.1 dihydrofolate synthase / folylpolyglutamate synthase [Allopseudospirillum japonicum]
MSAPHAHASLATWLDYLENLHPNQIDLGLERIRTVALKLNLIGPQAQPLAHKVISVAGTNGKGSSLAYLEQLSLQAGIKVGTYTSPHFLRYNERIRVQGQEVSDTEIVQAFARIEAARGHTSLTYFEFGTLAACLIFQQSALDIALLEVGLGGRLDAVNLIDADIAVVTSIALDHADWLGTDLQEIAYAKVGIARAHRPLVLGSESMPERIFQCAQDLHTPVYQLGKEFIQTSNGETWQWSNTQGKCFTQLPYPKLPYPNAATSLQAFLLTGYPITQAQIQAAVAQAQLTGRLQRHGPWLLDVAHNPHAASYIAQHLKTKTRRLAILGMMSDKDQAGVVKALTPYIQAWITTDLPLARAASAQTLAHIVQAQGGRVLAQVTDPQSAYQKAHAQLKIQAFDEVLVLGSFFTLAGLLADVLASTD